MTFNILSVFNPVVVSGALASLLTLAPNPKVSGLGLATSMGLIGYGAADVRKHLNSNKKGNKYSKFISTDRHLQDIGRMQNHIDELKNASVNKDMESTNKDLILTELYNRLKLAEDKIPAKDSQIAQMKRDAGSQIKPDKFNEYVAENLLKENEYLSQINLLKTEIDLLASGLAHSEEHYKSKRALENKETHQRYLLNPGKRTELENEIEGLNSRVEFLEENLKIYKEVHGKYVETFENFETDTDVSIEGIVEKASNEIVDLRSYIDELNNELSKEKNRPSRFGGLGNADIIGNHLIDFLIREDIITDAVETDPDTDKGLLVILKPKTATSITKVKELLGSLEVALKLYSLPTVVYKNGNYHFRLAVNPLQNTPETVTLKSNINKLEKSIDLANHIRLVGASGSGKSTFMENIIWLGKCLWPDSALDLFDPKYTELKTGGLKPNRVGGQECVDAIEVLTETMEARLADSRTYLDRDIEAPDYPKHIFAIDEAAYAFKFAKQIDRREGRGSKVAATFSDNLSSLLMLGRALSVKGYFVSQSALCSKVGLNVDEFDNAVSIFLNAAIDSALNDELKDNFTKDRRAAVIKDLDRRKAQGQKYIGLVSDLNNDDLYLFESPTPSFYFDRFQRENPSLACASNTPVSKAFPTFPVESQNHGKVNDCEAGSDLGNKTDLEIVGNISQLPSDFPVTSQVVSQVVSQPRGRCPKCNEGSTKLKEKAQLKSGKYRFICQNTSCNTKTFTTLPE